MLGGTFGCSPSRKESWIGLYTGGNYLYWVRVRVRVRVRVGVRVGHLSRYSQVLLLPGAGRGRGGDRPPPPPGTARQNNELKVVAMTMCLCHGGIRELSIRCSWPPP